jgi:hypothetical protein
MTGSERDDEFEAYLKRRRRIDRSLKSLDRLEPPAELDRIIIGHAREAIHGPIPVGHFRGSGLPAPRWALPMGMAATILLSLSILLDLGMKGAMQRDASWGPRAARTVAAPAELVLAMPPQPAVESAPEPASVAQLAPVAAPRLPASPSPFHLSIKTVASAGLPRAAAAAPLQGTASSNTSRVASDGSSAASDSDNARSRISGRFLAASRLRSVSGPSGSGSAEPIQAVSPAADRMEIVTVFGTRILERDIFPMPDFPADSLTSLMGAGPAPYVPDLSYISAENSLDWVAERRRHPNPREWLAHIKKMRAAGLATSADEELRRFHDAYPAVEVPPATPATDGGRQ